MSEEQEKLVQKISEHLHKVLNERFIGQTPSEVAKTNIQHYLSGLLGEQTKFLLGTKEKEILAEVLTFMAMGDPTMKSDLRALLSQLPLHVLEFLISNGGHNLFALEVSRRKGDILDWSWNWASPTEGDVSAHLKEPMKYIQVDFTLSDAS